MTVVKMWDIADVVCSVFLGDDHIIVWPLYIAVQKRAHIDKWPLKCGYCYLWDVTIRAAIHIDYCCYNPDVHGQLGMPVSVVLISL